jgi:predicted ATPase
MEQALGMYRGVGSGMVVPYFLTQLAGAHVMHGDLDRALERLADARRIALEGGEMIASAEIDRLEGEIRWRQTSSKAAVEPLFQRALDTARRQGAKLFELRAATSLARIGASGAAEALRDVIASLPEQTETRDLVDARNVLGA